MNTLEVYTEVSICEKEETNFQIRGPYRNPRSRLSEEFETTVTAEDERFDVDVIRLYIDEVEESSKHDDTLTYLWNTTESGTSSHSIAITAADTLNKTRRVQYTVTVAQPSSLLLPAIGLGGVAAVSVIVLFVLKKR
jgi:hypothetical protein